MRLQLENNKGHIIIDDSTGRILSVVVHNVIENKLDFVNLASFTSKDGIHTATRFVKWTI